MKNILVVTGGAGFVGSNLIIHLLNKTSFKIISIDNYSSGSRKNHIKNKRVKYINSHTKDINKICYKLKKLKQFLLGNLQEFIKAFFKWTNVFNQIPLEPMQFLTFV